jgi:hypothetical protein
MSTTPQTDAARLTEPYLVRELSFEVVRAEVMEELETELAAVTAERDALKAKLATINHIAMSLFVRATSSEVTGEMAEIGRLSREDGQ